MEEDDEEDEDPLPLEDDPFPLPLPLEDDEEDEEDDDDEDQYPLEDFPRRRILLFLTSTTSAPCTETSSEDIRATIAKVRKTGRVLMNFILNSLSSK